MSRAVARAILPAINIARRIMDDLGFRPYAVTLRRRRWSAGYQGRGVPVDTDLALSPAPKVRVVTQREVAASGGTFRDGDLKVGPITPDAAVIYGSMQHTGTGTGTVTAASNVEPTGVTQGSWSLVVSITTDGSTFKWSTDGGSTYSADIPIPATFQVPGIGVLLTFSGAFTPGDGYFANGTSVGYTAAQLRETLADAASELAIYLNGPDGTLACTLVRADFDRALKYTLWVRRTRTTP